MTLDEAIEREKWPSIKCYLCEGKGIESKFHTISIGHGMFGTTMFIENKPICPPFAKCSGKDMKVTTDLSEINYCPICGRNLIKRK